MNEVPEHEESSTPYIIAIVLGVMTGALLVLAILWIRPTSDPVTLITAVGTVATLITGQAILFIKSHDTGRKVDGALHQWLAAQTAMSRAEGKIEGVEQEQQRLIDQKLAAAAVGDRRIVSVTTAPVPPAEAAVQPVEIVAPAPIPVTISKKG